LPSDVKENAPRRIHVREGSLAGERDRIKGRSPRQAGSNAFRGADATYKNVAMIRTRTKTRAIARWDMRDISRY